ncbi:pleckstrin homology domain-containing family F member 1 [Pristis pectinata]|uniref:pleckstrin homology domain-containing family F member 1 n=1 Tax=Pristis pectinata TaxID=685728 RepID=UPI00223D890B|nr:pleckstrin homology domain-containing family F member 1 [Pristis pectinata]XP_051884460.1 pleckstrin homology domain-containing family F member 1 [Pristis pectinata]XP_051884461.1 pleckstrin homology domain-containing family F member 1 [Pristis pectinata]XP_051884462.1 pleckstrin homology domain-containing family F member 1 [Pristis pectinata]XP_051884463.1 pleckstrin homology domain-containing family F member 1 [Pristis pectinata]
MGDHLINTEINAQRIAAVENCFGANGQPLALPGRVLVGEGLLTKICRKKSKARMFFLFSDILVYGTIIIQKTKYAGQQIIPLENVTVQSLEDSDEQKNQWLIKTSRKSFVVCAATPLEKEDWMRHITNCVEQLLEKTGKTPSTDHAAPWIPDKMTEICMRCTQKKFNTITRRHHCRKCGFVVCHSCSKHKFLMPQQSSKPLRVCTLCYHQLVEEKNKESPSETKADKTTGQKAMVASNDEDSEKSSDDEKPEQWPGQEQFFSSDCSWSSFHTES